MPLTDGIFETGAYGVPSKSQNQPFWIKVVHLAPNVQTLAEYAVGTIRLELPYISTQYTKPNIYSRIRFYIFC